MEVITRDAYLLLLASTISNFMANALKFFLSVAAVLQAAVDQGRSFTEAPLQGNKPFFG